MNLMAGKTSEAGEAGDAGLRRDRLALLKARRQSLVDPGTEPSFGADAVPALAPVAAAGPVRSAAQALAAAPAAPAPGKGGLLASLIGGKLAGGNLAGGNLAGGKAARAQLLAKAQQLLTTTPPDADGMIADTGFSSAGLSLVLNLLRKRAEGEAAGGKAVRAVLNFLQASSGEAATPQGLSLAKVQMIAQKIGGLQGGGAAAQPAFAAPARAAAAVVPKFAAGGAGGFAGGMAGGGMAAGVGQAQRQMLGKLRHMLANTPADARGLVPGTDFSQAGVARLMQMLHQRAAAPGAQGGKMATRVLEMIAAAPGETGVIDGASLQKLRALASRLDRAG